MFRVNRDLLAAALQIKADIYVGNDWKALPAAAEAASRFGKRFVYDTHELGVEQHAEHFMWRLCFPRFISFIESRYIGNAAKVMTVSAGIARELQRRYLLDETPRVIRNTPPYQEVEWAPHDQQIEVLFHGHLMPNRNLEVLINSVPLWSAKWKLVIRGDGGNRYKKILMRLVSHKNLDDRIDLVPAVPRGELLKTASQSDIGIHVIRGSTNQLRYSLPNKFFEYMMAGLALCVTDLDAMAEIVREYDLGVLIEDPTPSGIAQALSTLDRSSIEKFRMNSLQAAKELCWEREQESLLAIFDRSLSS